MEGAWSDRGYGGKAVLKNALAGKLRGAKFDFFEAHIHDVEGKSVKFRDHLITIDFSRPFSGRTIVMRDKGKFQRKEKLGLKRVGLVDPLFENIFEAYGDDQVEARALLSPDLMQKMMDLERMASGKNIRFAFFDGELRIAVTMSDVNNHDVMNIEDMAAVRAQSLLDELGQVFDIINFVIDTRQASAPWE